MKNRYFFYEEAKDEYLGDHPGFLDIKNLREVLSADDDQYYQIPIEYQYRPDLISQKFYGSTRLHWIITFINDISNSPSDYSTGKILRIPIKERVYQAL